MALITLPANGYFSKVDKFQLLRSGATIRSKYTGRRQTIVHPFALWIFEGDLIPMEGTDAGNWRAFLAQLEGQKNTFQLPVPGADRPTAATNLIAKAVTAVTARAKSFAVTGTNNQAVLSTGDYFTINNELKIATSALTLSGTGTGTVAFEPGLRNPLVGSEPIQLRNPFCVMSADSDDSATWSLTKPIRHGIKISAVESF
jgi:hypothetical protein